MANWKENRRLAAIVLAAAVLLGVFGIGGMKARGLARGVQEAYAQSIAGDLALQAVRTALATLDDANSPGAAYMANTALTASVGLLYEETRKAVGDEKGGVLQTQWSEFLSRGNIIDNSAPAYNEQARAAQKKLSGFPASLVSALAGAHVEQFSA